MRSLVLGGSAVRFLRFPLLGLIICLTALLFEQSQVLAQFTLGLEASISGQEHAAKTREEHKGNRAAPNPAKENKKRKAQELLNRCYQEAIGTGADVRVETLSTIALSMQKINKDRALEIYNQAFNATMELQTSEKDPRWYKPDLQSRIVQAASSIDGEKALQMALKMDIVYPSSDDPNPVGQRIRNNTIAMVIARLASKDPDRGFQLLENQISQGNYDPGFIAGVTITLSKTRPHQAEQLFIEAIHQFEKPDQNPSQVQSFLSLTSRLFDLNHSLAQQALELIFEAVDNLVKKKNEKKSSFNATIVNSQGKTTSIGSIREYVAVQGVALMKRLDPERAKQLEEQFADFRESIAKHPNGLFPIAGTSGSHTTSGTTAPHDGLSANSMGDTGRSAGSDPSQPAAAGGGAGQQDVYFTSAKPSGGSQPPVLRADMDPTVTQMQTQMKIDAAVRTAAANPDTAADALSQLSDPMDKARAMVLIAAAWADTTSPERALSILSDAHSIAEKLSDPYDRANILASIGKGYSKLAPSRAEESLAEAFNAADRFRELQTKEISAHPESSVRTRAMIRPVEMLYEQIVSLLAHINIDEAIAMCEQISDNKMKLMSLIQVASTALNDSDTLDSERRIPLSPSSPK